MKRLFLIIVFALPLMALFSQVHLDFMNKAQQNRYYNKLQTAGVKGIIQYEYSGKAGVEADQPLKYKISWLNAQGKIEKTATFDTYRILSDYQIFYYNNAGLLEHKTYYEPDGSLAWSESFYHDVTGELVEAVEYSSEGALDARRLNVFNDEGFLYKKRELGPEDDLVFFTIAHLNGGGYPSRITLRHVRGFTMSSETITYNENQLPGESVVAIGLRGEPIRKAYSYNTRALLTGIKEYRGNKLESVVVIRYFGSNFGEYLRKNGFQIIESPSLTENEMLSPMPERMACFPGGEKALKEFIVSRTLIPENTTKQGVVQIGFEVKSNGKIRHVKVHRGLSEILDNQAVDIVKSMPDWMPSEDGEGRSVDSEVILPVPFIK